jgi:chaperone BCS1
MSISIFSLSGRDMSDANLLSLFQTLPPTTIVVLEDIDAIFLPQNKGKYILLLIIYYFYLISFLAKAVTFSGLLNALDGIASGEGRILFMTTNRIFNY